MELMHTIRASGDFSSAWFMACWDLLQTSTPGPLGGPPKLTILAVMERLETQVSQVPNVRDAIRKKINEHGWAGRHVHLKTEQERDQQVQLQRQGSQLLYQDTLLARQQHLWKSPGLASAQDFSELPPLVCCGIEAENKT